VGRGGEQRHAVGEQQHRPFEQQRAPDLECLAQAERADRVEEQLVRRRQLARRRVGTKLALQPARAEGWQHDAERRARRRWEQRVAEELDGTLQQTGRGVCRGELDEGRKESEERGLLLLGRDSAERDGTLLEHVDVQAAAGVVRESERVTAARE